MSESAEWPEIRLDRSARASTLRQQIERQVASAIRNGKLPYDCRLPSSRSMATCHNVSRGTVVEAYENLVACGMLVATAGSGIRVAYRSPGVPNFNDLKKTAIAAHYPTRLAHFEDCDGNPLYLNVLG